MGPSLQSEDIEALSRQLVERNDVIMKRLMIDFRQKLEAEKAAFEKTCKVSNPFREPLKSLALRLTSSVIAVFFKIFKAAMKEIEEEWKKLEAQKAAPIIHSFPSQKIKLDVGGVRCSYDSIGDALHNREIIFAKVIYISPLRLFSRYSTSLATLKSNDESMLASMFSGIIHSYLVR